MFYDCHTYKSVLDGDVRSIVNYKIGDAFLPNNYYSVGIHPWHVAEADFQLSEFETIVQYAKEKNLVAIGECGLDKYHDNLELQKQVFQMHIELANQIGKPLIVHCVKAYTDALFLLKKTKVPVIIHGINNKLGTIKSFLQRRYFFSFGTAILKQKSIARETILSIPDDLLLMETDDSDIPIQDIYKEAAKLRNIPLEDFTLLIEKNIKAIFKWE